MKRFPFPPPLLCAFPTSLLYVPLALFCLVACKPQADTRQPVAEPKPTQTFVYAPGGTNPNAQTVPVVPQAPRGLGCIADAETVPAEPGLRECCTKLKFGDACTASACWGKGLIARIKVQMQAGGLCAQ